MLQVPKHSLQIVELDSLHQFLARGRPESDQGEGEGEDEWHADHMPVEVPLALWRQLELEEGAELLHEEDCCAQHDQGLLQAGQTTGVRQDGLHHKQAHEQEAKLVVRNYRRNLWPRHQSQYQPGSDEVVERMPAF